MLLGMGCDLGRRPGGDEILGNASPIPLAQFLQSHQESKVFGFRPWNACFVSKKDERMHNHVRIGSCTYLSSHLSTVDPKGEDHEISSREGKIRTSNETRSTHSLTRNDVRRKGFRKDLVRFFLRAHLFWHRSLSFCFFPIDLHPSMSKTTIHPSFPSRKHQQHVHPW